MSRYTLIIQICCLKILRAYTKIPSIKLILLFFKQLKIIYIFFYIFGQEFVQPNTHVNHALLIRRCITEFSVKIVFISCVVLVYHIILFQTSFVLLYEAQNF